MKTVHKYPLTHLDGGRSRMEILTPKGTFKPLAVRLQRDVPTLWAEVDFGENDPVPTIRRIVEVVGTGHPVHDLLTYVDTLLFGQYDQLVLHYYVDARTSA